MDKNVGYFGEWIKKANLWVNIEKNQEIRSMNIRKTGYCLAARTFFKAIVRVSRKDESVHTKKKGTTYYSGRAWPQRNFILAHRADKGKG